MLNSSRSRWKLDEQIVISVLINLVQHIKPSHTTSVTQRHDVTLIGTHGAQEGEGDIHQLISTPENNAQGLGEQMHSSNEVTQRCP